MTVAGTYAVREYSGVRPGYQSCRVVFGQQARRLTLPGNLTFAGVSNIGERETHQDAAFFAQDTTTKLLLVVDGMGGMQNGDKAAGIATVPIERRFFAEQAAFNLAAAIVEAHARIIKFNQLVFTLHQGRSFGGTTINAALVRGNILQVASIGDSRAYLAREGQVYQFSPDDTSFNSRFFHPGEAGLLPFDPDYVCLGGAEQFPLNAEKTKEYYCQSQKYYRSRPGLLSKALGSDSEPPRARPGDRPTMFVSLVADALPPFSRACQLEQGDIVLLCTDGLHGYLPWQHFYSVLSQSQAMTPEEITNALWQEMAAATDRDNMTWLVHRYLAA